VLTLSLTHQQAHILRQTLESVLSDLSVEIADTDRKEYRDEIKAERDKLRQILIQLQSLAPSEAARP
jgi:acetolactate synthase small subunit